MPSNERFTVNRTWIEGTPDGRKVLFGETMDFPTFREAANFRRQSLERQGWVPSWGAEPEVSEVDRPLPASDATRREMLAGWRRILAELPVRPGISRPGGGG